MREGDASGYQRVDAGGVALILAVVEAGVEGADIFAPETLDDEHNDILLLHDAAGGSVYGAVDGLEFFFAGEIVGHGEHVLADGAIEGEGGVEHEGSLYGAVDVLVGIGDGDGAHGRSEAATNACHHEGRYECEREEHRHVVMPPAETIVAQRGVACQPVESPGDKGKQEDEVEVVQRLGEEDGAQILLVGKLREDGCRGAAHGEAEIAGIDEVDGQRHAVDDDEDPAAELLVGGPLLAVPGQQHQHDIGDIGDEDGGGVEDESGA